MWLPPKSLGSLHMGKVDTQIFSKEVVAQALILAILLSMTVGTGVVCRGSRPFPIWKMVRIVSVHFIPQLNVVRVWRAICAILNLGNSLRINGFLDDLRSNKWWPCSYTTTRYSNTTDSTLARPVFWIILPRDSDALVLSPVVSLGSSPLRPKLESLTMK